MDLEAAEKKIVALEKAEKKIAALGKNPPPYVLGQGPGTLMDPGPRAPKRPGPRGESPRVLGQGPGIGRAGPLYRSLPSMDSCWRPPSCGLAPSYGLALRARKAKP